MVGFGTSGFNFGVSLNANGQVGTFVYAASIGAGYNSGVSSLGENLGSSNFYNASGFAGYNDGNQSFGAGYAYSSFGGKAGQDVGALTLQFNDVTIRVDNDLFARGNSDKYRTGGAYMSIKVNEDLTVAFGVSMLTGDGTEEKNIDGRDYYLNSEELMPNVRGGIFHAGIVYKGEAYMMGWNSEKTLHSVQNKIHDHPWVNSPYFQNLNLKSKMYSYYGGHHKNYLFY